MKITIFNKTVARKYELYHSHFINCPGLLEHVFEFIVLGFNDMPTLVGHFVLSLREREKRDRRGSRERDEKE